MRLTHPSPNRDARPAGTVPDLLLLHYTGMPGAGEALERLRCPEAKVSAHYLLLEDGRVLSLVAEEERAWHAGASCWAGRERVNDFSIGIEIVNPGHEWGYRPFPPAQMAGLLELAAAICGRWGIPPERVLGHSDVAPARKEDPGELFDWPLLARAGLAVWPAPVAGAEPDMALARHCLGGFGYHVPDDEAGFAALLRAFQRHFRPERVDGLLDPSTMAQIRGLPLLSSGRPKRT
ncbi:N-acetylmuramoyl-L-alanine amidase [Geminicoccaceae bacterium 1502E]|nr:N-acetylmuramoyl-L-alanine amidase [Geminicoccaceae bacterium 1502E]